MTTRLQTPTANQAQHAPPALKNGPTRSPNHSFNPRCIPHTPSTLSGSMQASAEAIGLEPAERAPDGASPALDEGETVLAKFERLALVIGGTHEQGEGTLFITETCVG